MIFMIAAFVVFLLKKDQNKVGNLYDSAVCLPKRKRQEMSKAYKQYGFFYCRKLRQQKLKLLQSNQGEIYNEESESSDGQLRGDRLRQITNKRCQFNVNNVNKILFGLICAKMAL